MILAADMLVFPIVLSSISIFIAFAAFTVALQHFRMSRLPQVKPKFKTYSSAYPQSELRFDVEIESRGLPIHDMKVVLEADYEPIAKEFGYVSLPLNPVGTLPNPVNAGQVALFRLTGADIKGFETIFPMDRKLGISEMPEKLVTVAIYGSGQRLVKRFGRNQLVGFAIFDCIQHRNK